MDILNRWKAEHDELDKNFRDAFDKANETGEEKSTTEKSWDKQDRIFRKAYEKFIQELKELKSGCEKQYEEKDELEEWPAGGESS